MTNEETGTEAFPVWSLTPTQVLYINPEHARPYDSDDLDEDAPEADLGQTSWLLAHGFGDQQVFLERAGDDLLRVAALAIEQREHDEAALTLQANSDPACHPLFEEIQTYRFTIACSGSMSYGSPSDPAHSKRQIAAEKLTSRQ